MRDKANFAYFTGTNKQADVPMITTMIRSARSAGVPEDFHVFAPATITEGEAVNHSIPVGFDWRGHMAKLDLLRQFKESDYDYLVWLDADNYFVRDPGDLSGLIRSNKCWVSSEGEITGRTEYRFQSWWGIPMVELAALMQSLGCGERVWNTNGGMWIVRREAIEEFAASCEAIWSELIPKYNTMSDEPPLAITGQTLVPDPELNTIDHASDVWAIDWGQHRAVYKDRLPDGNPWVYEDYLSGQTRVINPAIVHAMCSKDALRAASMPKPVETLAEPVGDKLHELLMEIGISRPACQSCRAWMDKMNIWGTSGCSQPHNRRDILHRLAEASDTASWLDMAKVAKAGYFSCGSLLDEAIKRAQAV